MLSDAAARSSTSSTTHSYCIPYMRQPCPWSTNSGCSIRAQACHHNQLCGWCRHVRSRGHTATCVEDDSMASVWRQDDIIMPPVLCALKLVYMDQSNKACSMQARAARQCKGGRLELGRESHSLLAVLVYLVGLTCPHWSLRLLRLGLHQFRWNRRRPLFVKGPVVLWHGVNIPVPHVSPT